MIVSVAKDTKTLFTPDINMCPVIGSVMIESRSELCVLAFTHGNKDVQYPFLVSKL